MSNSPIVGRVNVTRPTQAVPSFVAADILPLTDLNTSSYMRKHTMLSPTTQLGVALTSAKISTNDADWTITQKLFSTAAIGGSYYTRASLDNITDSIGTQTITTSVAKRSGKMVTT